MYEKHSTVKIQNHASPNVYSAQCSTMMSSSDCSKRRKQHQQQNSLNNY